MIMKKTFVFLLLWGVTICSMAQNVGIGTSSPNASAALDISAGNKGLLPPRVTLTGINDSTTILSPATGLLVYNTINTGVPPNNVEPGYYYYTGTGWLRLSDAGAAPGDMQYWNGKQWVIIPNGTNGQTLTMCNGVPSWGPCPTGILLPVVSTGSVNNITGGAATGGGEVTSNGGALVTAKGVCYGTSVSPTLSDNVVTAPAAGPGTYSVSLVNLLPNTLYYARAFATNSIGTAYGFNTSFNTTAASLPSLTTAAASSIGSSSVSCGGNITNNGGSSLSARGIVYSISPNPTLSSTVVTDGGTSTGAFSLNITGLAGNTQYFAKAFATNQLGTAYGNEITFTTLSSGAFAATYNFDSVTVNSGLTDPTAVPFVAGVNFNAFTANGAGAPTLNPTTSGRFSFTGWTLGAVNGSDVFPSGDTTTRYYEVTVTTAPGKTIDLSTVSFRLQRSGTGARQAFVRSSRDNYTANLPAVINPINPLLAVVPDNKFQVTDATTSGQDGCMVTLGGGSFTGITGAVSFRFYGINAEAPGGTFSIDNVTINGNVY